MEGLNPNVTLPLEEASGDELHTAFQRQVRAADPQEYSNQVTPDELAGPVVNQEPPSAMLSWYNRMQREAIYTRVQGELQQRESPVVDAVANQERPPVRPVVSERDSMLARLEEQMLRYHTLASSPAVNQIRRQAIYTEAQLQVDQELAQEMYLGADAMDTATDELAGPVANQEPPSAMRMQGELQQRELPDAVEAARDPTTDASPNSAEPGSETNYAYIRERLLQVGYPAVAHAMESYRLGNAVRENQDIRPHIINTGVLNLSRTTRGGITVGDDGPPPLVPASTQTTEYPRARIRNIGEYNTDIQLHELFSARVPAPQCTPVSLINIERDAPPPTEAALCCICLVNAPNIVMLECGHACLCTGCSVALIGGKEIYTVPCPLCKALIGGTIGFIL